MDTMIEKTTESERVCLGPLPTFDEFSGFGYIGLSEAVIRKIHENAVEQSGILRNEYVLEMRIKNATLICVFDQSSKICIHSYIFSDTDE